MPAGKPPSPLAACLIPRSPSSCWLRVKVVPKAKAPGFLGVQGEAVKVAVTAAPEKGEANAQLVTLVAQLLRLRPSQVQLVRGQKGRQKLLALQASSEAVLQALTEALK